MHKSTQKQPKSRNGKRPSYKAPVQQTEVLARRMRGESKRKIAREMRLDRKTVTRILSTEEVDEKVARTRSMLLNVTDKMAKRYEKIALHGEDQHAAGVIGKTFDGLQVFQPKSHQAVTTTHKSELEGRTKEDVAWYLRFGTPLREWPTVEEKAFFAQYGIWPQEATE